MRLTQGPDLYLGYNDSNERGVYAASEIVKNDLIEFCPVITLNTEDTIKIHQTKLHDYYFVWDLEAKTSAIALGFGSIYNHSENPNAEFLLDKDNMQINFFALSKIGIGEEITTNYIGLQEEGFKLWFEST